MSEAEALAVAIEGDRPALVIEHLLEYAVTVEPAPDVLVVTVGEQGPPGRDAIAADLPTDPLAYYILARS